VSHGASGLNELENLKPRYIALKDDRSCRSSRNTENLDALETIEA